MGLLTPVFGERQNGTSTILRVRVAKNTETPAAFSLVARALPYQ